MPADRSDRVEFTDVDAVVDAMSAVRSGGWGWVNLAPAIDPDTPVPSNLGPLAVFSKRGPVIPLATWTPPRTGGRGTPATVGLQHGVASAIKDRLVNAGAGVPASWRIATDHPKRGLVAEVSLDESDETVAAWMLQAVDLASIVPHLGLVDVDRFVNR